RDVVVYPAAGHGPVTSLVVFLGPGLTGPKLDDLLGLAARSATEFIAVVSTFRAHLGDQGAIQAEEDLLARAGELPARTVVFRPGHVVSPRSRAAAWLRRFGFLYPLVPRRLHGCCLDGEELFAAIEAERRSPGPRRTRIFTLLGPNRPWRELLAERRAKGF